MRFSPLRKVCVGVVAATAALGLAACGASNPSDGDSSDAKKSGSSITVTDVTGRQVTFDSRPEKILLAEGRGLFATSILNKENPTEHVVAIGSDMHSAAPTFEEKLSKVDEKYSDLPTVGDISKGDVTVENLLAYKPDVTVLSLDHKKAAEESGLLDKMDQAGLKYVFSDFRQKPLENTTKTISLYGQLLGKEDKAKEFNDFYDGKVKNVTDRANKAKDKPKTLVWRAAGMKDCCGTVKNSNLGDLVNAAGGKNIGDDLLDTESGDLTAEKVLAEQPEQIIATGGAWAKDPEKPEVLPHVELGYTAKPDVSEKTLKGLLATPGFNALKAPKEGKLHAVYHQFYDSPLNVFALEQFAQWLHPELFQDLDVEKDFADFHKKWLPFEYSGTFFTSTKS